MKTRRWLILLVGMVVVWGLLSYYPVRTQVFRLAIVAAGLLMLVCLTGTLWRWKKWRFVPLAIVGLVAILFVLPGRQHDPDALRAAYVGRLESYSGVKYVWGGEGFCGVDCSGFLRAAMVDALMKESVRTMNPALARKAVWLWWHDASANDMGQEYDGITRQLGPVAPLPEAGNGLHPGDFGVTSDGSHVMAYLGKGSWIEADPTDMRVEMIEAEAGKGWGLMKVVPCRWRWLEK